MQDSFSGFQVGGTDPPRGCKTGEMRDPLDDLAQESGGETAERAARLVHTAVLRKMRDHHRQNHRRGALYHRGRQPGALRNGVDDAGAQTLLRLVWCDLLICLIGLLPGVDVIPHPVLLEILQDARESSGMLLYSIHQFRGDGSMLIAGET